MLPTGWRRSREEYSADNHCWVDSFDGNRNCDGEAEVGWTASTLHGVERILFIRTQRGSNSLGRETCGESFLAERRYH